METERIYMKMTFSPMKAHTTWAKSKAKAQSSSKMEELLQVSFNQMNS
jgi:hypothetical protein